MREVAVNSQMRPSLQYDRSTIQQTTRGENREERGWRGKSAEPQTATGKEEGGSAGPCGPARVKPKLRVSPAGSASGRARRKFFPLRPGGHRACRARILPSRRAWREGRQSRKSRGKAEPADRPERAGTAGN